MKFRSIVSIGFGLAMTVVFSGCSVIDEDMSDCDEALTLDYDLHLITNESIELQKEFDRQADADLVKALRSYFAPIFTDYANDLNLSFYDVQGDSVRLEHDQHDMNGKEESYTLNIPRRHYLHLATANVKQEQSVEDFDAELCHTARLAQLHLDTIPSHTTGLFSARYDMDIKDSIDQTFNVHLYMANSATVLVIDTLDSHVRDIKVYATGFATGFNMADSTYTFDKVAPIVRSVPVDAGDEQYACFTTVNFPSRDQLVIPVNAPHRASDDDVVDGLWEYHLYITTAKGSVTRSILRSYQPLHAEQVLVVHVKLEPDGSAETTDALVGVSVTLEWHDGGTYNPEL